MAFAVFKLLKRHQNLAANVSPIKFYCRARHTANTRNLFSRISPLGDPFLSVVPVLDQWVQEGGKVNYFELQRIVRDLRARKRYRHALDVSEWMSSKGLCQFLPGDHAVQLDLIGRVRGLDAAESCFSSLSDEDTSKSYGALLNCYVREGLIDKSLSHMQKMKELGFATSLNYNDIMRLYIHTGQPEKIPDVLSEMKEEGVSPDNFSYRICMSSYGMRSDISSMEKVLEEMEREQHISMDWLTYALVANLYIKAGLHDKALIYLEKSEEKVNKDALGYNHLISLYASLGCKDDMMRLWSLEKTKCKKQINRDYITMLGSLVKLGELEETKKLLEEWELSCLSYDFRVPNILLIGYCQRGLVEQAEDTLRDIVKKGKTPTPNSWAILAAGYVDKQKMQKAFECMTEALNLRARNTGWRPKPGVVSSVLSWIGDNGDIEQVEAFVSLMKTVITVNREMYHALMKAYIRSGREVEVLLHSMKEDQIEADDEILSLRQK
ncbi:unnamed protein product [Prunus armeniaca]|uniref:Pentacotripeptide-repeat region of PRORP domain-containing protein n=1 Tax=Prunus armeniaca TaxID=36596 RepID=A0A6J5UN65_PRUAR|nr:unnamed protein product [Prunus armeniaca]